LPTPFSESVERLYEADPEWMAPLLWKSEFRNVLALYLRKGLLSLETALQLQGQAESIMEQNEFEIASAPILTLAKESGCSAYDCEFISLAHQLNVPLVTQDKKLLREFSDTAISIDDFLNNRP